MNGLIFSIFSRILICFFIKTFINLLINLFINLFGYNFTKIYKILSYFNFMSKLPIIINFCDNNRRLYSNETYDHILGDSRFKAEKWNCLSDDGNNFGERCWTFCNISPYIVIGNKSSGEEISGNTHKELFQNILNYVN